MLHVVWFKRDLRITDHAPLAGAAAAGTVLPLYVAEPLLWREPVAAARQWRFVAGALRELSADLAALGAPLVARTGDAVAVLEAIRARHGIAALWSHEETGDGWTYARDRRVAAWARAAGIPWHEIQGAGVVRRLASRDGWAERWERTMRRPPTLPPAALAPHGVDPGAIPSAGDLGLAPDVCADIAAGSRAARATLGSFLTERGEHYRRAMSSPVTGYDACSRISPHLAWGTLSTREALAAARAARAAAPSPAWAGSIDSFIARLHWRCHFMQKLEDEPAIERRCMHPGFEGLREADHDPARLAAWEQGETGLPMLDACMRALRATGWLNFRMRAMVTAVAAYHLWLDWRRFGPPLARLFTDFEPGIHWSQAQMQSGVTGINTLRIYNPVKQSQDQDPEGVFLRRWLPELARVPGRFVHQPWTMPADLQREAGCRIGTDYPAPLVEPVAAARLARERIGQARRQPGFWDGQKAVLVKHASRKRGRARTETPPKPDRQLALDL